MNKIVDTGRITEALAGYRKSGWPFKALIGMDGFVDEIMCVVDKRLSVDNFTKVATLDAFGGRISRAAGLSTNIEFVSIVQKLGGNGPIMANAMSELDVSVSYIGALGEPSIHPVFAPMREKCATLISITDPGLSFNLEFEDGKLIMSKLDSLNKITWEALKERFGLTGIADMLGDPELNLLGLTNWTMIPHLSAVFKGIIEEVFPLTKSGNALAVFDLCDPEKRLPEDLAEAMSLIRRFSDRFRVVLGVNLKEATQVAAALGVDVKAPGGLIENIDLEELTVKVGQAMGTYGFVIHTLKEASAYCDGAYHYAPGYFTPHPVLTTGAGDNFNAGLCLGMLLNLPMSDALLLGNASSGYYVRKAGSADLAGLIDFLNEVEPTI